MERNNKRRRISLRTQIGMGIIVLAIVLVGLSLGFYYNSVKNMVFAAYIEKGVIATGLAAKQVSGEEVNKFLAQGKLDSNFAENKDYIFRAIKKNFALQYFYLFVPREDDVLYVYSAYNQGDAKHSKVFLGQVEQYSNMKSINEVTKTGKTVKSLDITDTDKYGYLASVYAPVFDQEGNVVAIFAADFSMDKVLGEISEDVQMAAFWIVIAIVLLLAIYSYAIKQRLLEPLKQLTVSTQNFVGQCNESAVEKHLNLEPIVIAGNNELTDLADACQQMAMDIKSYISNLQNVTAAKQAIETELNVAKNIQEMLLPHIFPPFTKEDHFSIYATIEAAKSVGGDYYDFYMIDNDHVCFTIADVSGKGVPAALFMVIAKTIMKNQAMTRLSPDQILARTNNQLNEDNEEGMFVTAFLAILEVSTGKLSYANAGHNPPLIRRGNGDFEFLPLEKNIVLAIMDDMEFKPQETIVAPGDILFLYTDGITEAMNNQQEQYNETRLLDCLNDVSAKNTDLEKIINKVRQSVSDHVDGAEQSDDITMMVVRLDEFSN